MPREEGKKRQASCSFCSKSGHTKINCPEFLRIRREKKNAVIGNGGGHSIFVRTFSGNIPSKFILDLGHDDEAVELPSYSNPVRQELPFIRPENFDRSLPVVSVHPDLKLLDTSNQFNSIKRERNIITPEPKRESIMKNFSVGFVPEARVGQDIQNGDSPDSRVEEEVEDRDPLRQSMWNFFASKKPNFQSPKFIFAAVGLFLILILPYPAYGYLKNLRDTGNRVMSASTNAFALLQSSTVAAFSANIPQAESDLNGALSSFYEATNIMDKEHRAAQFVAGLLPVIGEKIISRQHLLTAGQHLALGNTYLVKGVSEAEKRKDLSLTDRIELLRIHLQSGVPEYERALADLSQVSAESLPVEYQSAFADFKVLFSAFIGDMSSLQELSRSIKLIFGSDQLQRYLVMFQNENELRPTGGFWGSFAVMSVQKGKIIQFEIPGGGTYDLQGQYDISVKPPLPLQIINKRWELQDANWFPDFAASAAKASWFYRHGRGASIDGVIAINASVLERLLRVMGPIESSNFGVAVSADDAVDKIQKHVEIDYDKTENKPKALLGDLTNELVGKLTSLNSASAIKLLGELNEALAEKEIQIYSTNSEVQAKMAEYGWTGEIYDAVLGEDYLNVVSANIFGGKTNAVTNQTIRHEVQVTDSGEVYDTVRISRTHAGLAGQLFYGQKNIEYIRVYVPLGAELVDAGGFKYPDESAFTVPESWYEEDMDLNNFEREVSIHGKTGTRITEEFGKTVFGNWSIVEPGATEEVYFRYKLPFNIGIEERGASSLTRAREVVLGRAREASSYRVVYQKQSGTNPNLEISIAYPDEWREVWDSEADETITQGKNKISFSQILTEDKAFGILMAKE